jgi:hypothetical protein
MSAVLVIESPARDSPGIGGNPGIYLAAIGNLELNSQNLFDTAEATKPGVRLCHIRGPGM